MKNSEELADRIARRPLRHGDKGTPIVQFSELSGGGKEVVILYQEREYRLRLTKNGKLILNR